MNYSTSIFHFHHSQSVFMWPTCSVICCLILCHSMSNPRCRCSSYVYIYSIQYCSSVCTTHRLFPMPDFKILACLAFLLWQFSHCFFFSSHQHLLEIHFALEVVEISWYAYLSLFSVFIYLMHRSFLWSHFWKYYFCSRNLRKIFAFLRKPAKLNKISS